MKFIFGTTNRYKTRELAAILTPLDIDLDITDPIDPEETGDTLQENARIKAVAYGKYVGQRYAEQLMATRKCSEMDARLFLRMNQVWVISEDSGLTVPALEGLPGPWSARFDDCTFEHGKLISHVPTKRSREEIDEANNQRVLDLMQGIEQPHRAAAFEICLMVADTDGTVLFETSHSTTGWILNECLGSQGFGYDPIFASDTSFGNSWAQIDSMRKNLISHRREVLYNFTAWLATQLKAQSL